MISDFTISPNNAFETTEFWCIVGLTAILTYYKGKTPLFFNL